MSGVIRKTPTVDEIAALIVALPVEELIELRDKVAALLDDDGPAGVREPLAPYPRAPSGAVQIGLE